MMLLLHVFSMLCVVPAAGWGAPTTPASGNERAVAVRDGDMVPIDVRVSDAAHHVLTAVTFPDLVQDVVSSWDERDLSVDCRGARLFLKLLSDVEGNLDVVLADGTYLRLYIRPVKGEGDSDGHVTLESAAPEPPGNPTPETPAALELVKAMRLGTVPAGATVRGGSDAALFQESNLEGRLAWVYDTARYRGYVLRLLDKSASQTVGLDMTRFSSPRLVLVGAKSLFIPPGGSTFLYLVFWK